MEGPGSCEFPTTLLEKISYKADIELCFTADKQTVSEDSQTRKRKCSEAEGTSTAACVSEPAATDSRDDESSDNKLQINSYILSTNSSVLAPLLQLALAQTGSDSTTGLKQVPMEGTCKADFLEVLKFLYPATPLPKVTWDNLEVLLVEGNKWDMQVALAYAAEFVQVNANSLDLHECSPKYALKWLQLVDKARLEAACITCINKIVALGPYFSEDKLEGLSPKTMIKLIGRMQQQMAAMQNPGSSSFHDYCCVCGGYRSCRYRKCCDTCNKAR